VLDPWFGPYRQQAATSRSGITNLVATPRRRQECRGDHAGYRVSPAQLLVQPLLSLLTHPDAIVGILIQEHWVVFSNQPLAQLTGALAVFAGMADEYPGHHRSLWTTAK
jgi:hypothetical protein